MANQFMSMTQVSEALGVTKQTLRNWNKKGILTYRMLGGRVYYLESDIINKIKTKP